MQFEEYLDFLPYNTIRIKGHRISLDQIVDLYNTGRSPEEIAAYYPTITLEQVYAAILYYLRNKERIDADIADLNERTERAIAESEAHPSPAVLRVRTALRERRLQDTKQAASAQ